ncbi:MAG: Ig-like domain-containing protein [Bacteroidota bacterium]
MTRPLQIGLLALALVPASGMAQTVTGLDGWSLYLDPGHSQTENQGIYGYSEAEKVLRIGLALQEMLLTRTDIDTVYISRTTDTQQVSLSQRTDDANALGADFFHSIHSNAAGPSTNNVLMLHGGWRSGGQTVEKTPVGGKRMGDEFEEALASAMRLPTIGNFADRTFYQGFPDNHTNQFPFLSVNRRSNMASVLSEGGFHTNPIQNTRNMNADWKRLEAQAHYWAILDWHGVPRSIHRIATGIVTDAESGRPINGATVEIDGQTYTTDTFESLFNQYASDPDELANGFYYLEDLSPGTHTVTVSAPGYATATASVTMLDTEFSFADVQLVSTIPPTVVEADPEADEDGHPITDPLDLTFSRPLDPATAAPAFSLVPTDGGDPVAGAVSFTNSNYRLVFTPDAPLTPRIGYTLTLAGTATTANGSALDGDGDGTGGDDFVLAFVSSFADTQAPRLEAAYPRPASPLRPVLSATFTEPVVPATLDGRIVLTVNATEAEVAGRFEHDLAGVVGEDPAPRSVVHFVPDADLEAGVLHRFSVQPGVEDRFGNASTSRSSFTFTPAASGQVVTVIDGFEGDSIVDHWWEPQQSGSTTGIVTDSTSRGPSDRAFLLGGETSLRIDYGWPDDDGAKLIRQYLSGGPPRSVFFDSGVTLRARVFGDGNGTLFRFAVDDGTGGAHEVSPWTAVDWYGWRDVTWDLDADGFGTWIGNGSWDNPSTLRFDSFQLSSDGTTPRFGELYVDDFAFLRGGNVASDGGPEAEALVVGLARPNPFRDQTEIGFSLGAPTSVTVRVFNAIGQEVAVLAEQATYAAGMHTLTWDAQGLASGVYVARVDAADETATIQMVLTR